ncbi:MAG: FKBP-type peptidyl-prolyl cis-trans isomerase [Paludibacteraceae bacterium]|nr:FKBP-type peptidyl-prolyl cis-trans isomerase [Paludibacteraceae bacterium]
MKRTVYILTLLALLLTSCKQDNWMDWKLQNEMWLEANKLNKDVQTSSTGLQYKIKYAGNPTDAKPDDASTIIVSYTGHLINGYQFDEATNASLSMNPKAIIEGFAEGMKKIHAHGDIELYIPQELGYGDSIQGVEGSYSGSFIPPYSTLIFDIHLQAVTK